jgi:hypothetical protein
MQIAALSMDEAFRIRDTSLMRRHQRQAEDSITSDPLEEVATRQIRARLWQNGELLQEEVHTQKVEDYSKHELLLILERAGFSDITITGDYHDEPATADHTKLVFVARK